MLDRDRSSDAPQSPSSAADASDVRRITEEVRLAQPVVVDAPVEAPHIRPWTHRCSRDCRVLGDHIIGISYCTCQYQLQMALTARMYMESRMAHKHEASHAEYAACYLIEIMQLPAL